MPLGTFPFKSVIRFGSSTIVRNIDVEINTIDAIRILLLNLE